MRRKYENELKGSPCPRLKYVPFACWEVAYGRLTCYWEYDLSSWDIAAGALLVQEADGKFTDLQGQYTRKMIADYTRKMIASNGLVHDGILHILRVYETKLELCDEANLSYRIQTTEEEAGLSLRA